MTMVETQKEYLDLTEARGLIKSIAHIEVPGVVLHTATGNKKVRTLRESITNPQKKATRTFNRATTTLYNASDIRKLTEQFLEFKGDLLTLEEAYKLFVEKRYDKSLTLEQFRRLVTYHNIPTVDAVMWYQQLFSRERVIATAQLLPVEELETMIAEDTTLYTMQEAVAYLSQKWHVEVQEQTLYHMVHRNALIPAVRPRKGTIKKAYRFTKSSLDALSGIRSYEKAQGREAKPEPIHITNTDMMGELVQKYGKLIATPEAVAIIMQKSGRNINESTAMFHLREKIGPVVEVGHMYFYAKDRVEQWVSRPLAGNKAQAKTGMRQPRRKKAS